MKKHLILALVAVALVFTACAPQAAEAVDAAAPVKEKAEAIEIIHNTAEEFESNMQGEYLLLDVRTQGEYDAGHIEGSTLIPVDELESRLSEIEEYKDTPILVYCRSGNRSVTASNILINNGFTKVHNLLGGIGAWNSYKGN